MIAPEHIWSKVENPATFGNYDLEAGLPVGTGPYKLVRSTETEQVYDRLHDWAAEFDPEYAALLDTDPDYAKAIISIGRGGKKPRGSHRTVPGYICRTGS